jgi:hypothetical protein
MVVGLHLTSAYADCSETECPDDRGPGGNFL